MEETIQTIAVRKIIQIEVGASGELVALCDDGTLWENDIDAVKLDSKYKHEWMPLLLPPQVITPLNATIKFKE